MNRFKQKLTVMFVSMFVLGYFYPIAHGSGAEIWELQWTGDVKGALKMILKREGIEKDVYSIAGKFSGSIQDYEAGPGRLRCKLKGRIEKGVLVADFSGYADMAVSVRVRGNIKGTVSNSQGVGTWSFTHSQGSRAGEWAMRRAKPSQ